jgi:gamma-glutamyltranspeptidase / glutathione hydrolase
MPPIKVNWDLIDNSQPSLERFPSRRSVVYGTKGVVACSQPLACQAGIEILNKGGNASMYTYRPVLAPILLIFMLLTVDAAVATSMALNVTEP